MYIKQTQNFNVSLFIFIVLVRISDIVLSNNNLFFQSVSALHYFDINFHNIVENAKKLKYIKKLQVYSTNTKISLFCQYFSCSIQRVVKIRISLEKLVLITSVKILRIYIIINAFTSSILQNQYTNNFSVSSIHFEDI